MRGRARSSTPHPFRSYSQSARRCGDTLDGRPPRRRSPRAAHIIPELQDRLRGLLVHGRVIALRIVLPRERQRGVRERLERAEPGLQHLKPPRGRDTPPASTEFLHEHLQLVAPPAGAPYGVASRSLGRTLGGVLRSFG